MPNLPQWRRLLFAQPHCTSSMGQLSSFEWHFSETNPNVFLLFIHSYTNIFKAQIVLFYCIELTNGGKRKLDQQTINNLSFLFNFIFLVCKMKYIYLPEVLQKTTLKIGWLCESSAYKRNVCFAVVIILLI